MANDGTGLRDEVGTELNPAVTGSELATGQPPPVPDRPADGAPKATWVDYVVALGADRGFVSGETVHYDGGAGEHVQAPALTRDQLVDLADRLGG